MKIKEIEGSVTAVGTVVGKTGSEQYIEIEGRRIYCSQIISIKFESKN